MTRITIPPRAPRPAAPSLFDCLPTVRDPAPRYDPLVADRAHAVCERVTGQYWFPRLGPRLAALLAALADDEPARVYVEDHTRGWDVTS